MDKGRWSPSPSKYLIPCFCLVFLLCAGLAGGEMLGQERYSSSSSQIFSENQRLRVIRKAASTSPVPQSIDHLRRVLACQRLARRADADAVKKLLLMARDTSPIVRAHATSALAEFRAPEALRVLVTSLTAGDWRTRRCAAEALGQFSDVKAQRALARALEDSSEWVRVAAKRSLTKLSAIETTNRLVFGS